MSKYSDKIMRGEAPTDQDWAEHLKEAHKIAPSMTPQAFASYKTENGGSSYQFLADAVQDCDGHAAQIVDLACGDGHLIPYLLPKLNQNGRIVGIDMSEGELGVAKRSITDQRVTFHLTTAQNLPLEDGSVDHAVCHMAFMLMLPVEPVVNELGRVLKPKGKFSAVIGSRSSTGLFGEVQRETVQFIDSRYPKVREARPGDPRVGSLDGLNQLFNKERGFERIEALTDFHIEINTAPEGIWNLMKDMYFVGMLPDKEKSELKNELIALGKDGADASGKVSLKFPMKMFTAQRTGI